MLTTDARALLHDVLDAHGGLQRWTEHHRLATDVVSGGLLYEGKGQPRDSTPRHVQVTLDGIATTVRPFGGVDRIMRYSPMGTSIETCTGDVLDTAPDPRPSFRGHTLTTPWSPLQRAYFSGYALWTYLNSPFLLALPGVELRMIGAVEDDTGTLRGLEARIPASIPTHSRTQRFYFDPGGLLRRHDYRVDVAGFLPVGQRLTDYIEVDGIALAATRSVYGRASDGTLNREEVMVAMQFSDIHFSTKVDR